jgi:hypothetical protein
VFAARRLWASLGESEMNGPRQCSSQPQFMTSVGNNSLSNGAGTPLIDSIDVDQIVIPEVWSMCMMPWQFFIGFGKNNYRHGNRFSCFISQAHSFLLQDKSTCASDVEFAVYNLMSQNQLVCWTISGYWIQMKKTNLGGFVLLQKTSWKNLFSYIGPGFLVSIAYIDPGNCKIS